MSEIEQGGYVYARSSHISPEFNQNGITRRDWLAGLAMQGELASQTDDSTWPVGKEEGLARRSYIIADAIIAAGKKGGE